MKIGYITQVRTLNDIVQNKRQKMPTWIKRCCYQWKKVFHIVTKKEDMYILPFMKVEDKRIKKVTKKMNKMLKTDHINHIVLSERLQEDCDLKNQLYAQNMQVFNGRKLFHYLIQDVIEYIVTNCEKQLDKMDITILVNDNNELNTKRMIELAKQVKRLNIVTNNGKRFKKIEKYLYDELGIMITIGNNKKKSLANSTIVINLDFPEELVNKFTINRKAILVHIEDKVQIYTKSFKGINVNFYELQSIPEYEEIWKYYEGFNRQIIYESLLFQDKQVPVEQKLEQDKVCISNLIGNNGKIEAAEFKRKK